MKFAGTDNYVATQDLMLAVNAAITLKRPGDGIAPVELEQVLGRRLKTAAVSGHTLQWGDLA
jgi:sialic acid synthase SpsE